MNMCYETNTDYSCYDITVIIRYTPKTTCLICVARVLCDSAKKQQLHEERSIMAVGLVSKQARYKKCSMGVLWCVK